MSGDSTAECDAHATAFYVFLLKRRIMRRTTTHFLLDETRHAITEGKKTRLLFINASGAVHYARSATRLADVDFVIRQLAGRAL